MMTREVAGDMVLPFCAIVNRRLVEDVVVEWVDDGRSGSASCGFVEWR